MEGELIVRIFVHGLLLLAPEYGADASQAAEDHMAQVDTAVQVGALRVLLVDARDGQGSLEPHWPYLVHCAKDGGEPCGAAVQVPLAEDEPFEDLTLRWVESGRSRGTAPTAGSVELRPPSGRVRGRFPTPPDEDDGFGWVASLSEALGEPDPLELEPECKESWPDAGKCPAVARMTLTEGVVGTCGFVEEPDPRPEGAESSKIKKTWIPAPEYVNRRNGIDRAMAGIVVVELSRRLSNVAALEIRGATRSGGERVLHVVDPKATDLDTCPGRSEAYCAEIALMNLPKESRWHYEAKHFKALYDLVKEPPGVRLRPFPMVLRGAVRRDREAVQDTRCSMPGSFYEVGGFTTGKKGFLASLFGLGGEFKVFHIEDRPICPPGTL